MKRAAFIFLSSFVLILFGVQKGWPNGGPVAWTETTPVGMIGLEQSTEVTLKKEHLNIKITSLNNYRIEASYELSSTKSIQNLKFGVPINWFIEYRDIDPKKHAELSNQPPTEKIVAEINEISRSINMSLNNNKVSCTPVYSSHLFTLAKEEDLKLNEHTNIRGWCISEINLNKGINKLILEYSGQLDFEDYQYTKSALTRFSDRRLSYLLYPAGYWNGVVDEINVNIDPGPYYGYINFTSPNSVFTKKGKNWTWKGSKIDLKKIRKIEVVLSKKIPLANELANWNNHSYARFSDYAQVKASSELAPVNKIKYNASNVFDGNLQTAWCASDLNKSESIFLEFRSKESVFEDPKSIGQYCGIEGLMIATGYTKSQKVYSSNNRIKKIAISDCNGKYREVYSVKPDKDYRFGATLIKNELPKEAWNKFIKAYQAKHGNNYTHPDYKKAPKRKMDYIKQTSCFRIEILETEKSEDNDTCISEMALVINCY